MRAYLYILFSVLLAATISCSGSPAVPSGQHAAPSAPGWPQLPGAAVSRGVSALQQVAGNETYARSKAGVTDVPESALQLQAAGSYPAWAIYGYGLPGTATLGAGHIEISAVTGEYWLGFSDYGTTAAWEWHGPYTSSNVFEFSQAAGNYVNPARSFYWAAVVTEGCQAVVEYTELDVIAPPFAVPAAGQHTIDPTGQSPSLALHPGNTEGAEAGAPLIAYISTDGTSSQVMLAYYSGAQWHSYAILPERNLASPQLSWDAAGGQLIAFDTVAGGLYDFHLDDLFQVSDETQIFTPAGAYFAKACRMVRHPDGTLAVIHTYTGISTDAVYFSQWTDAGGWETDPELYNGEGTMDLSVALNPLTVEPAVAFTHGTANTEGQVTLDYTLEYGTRTGGTWNIAPFSYPDSVVMADLSFLPDGTPQLGLSTNRTWVFNLVFPPVHYEGDFLFDGVVATGNGGGGWDFDVFFTSTISPAFQFPQTVVLTLHEVVFPRWAKPGELSYAYIEGDVNADVVQQEITGGNLENATHYATDQGSGFGDTSYFTGDPGLYFSWASLGAQHACAYNYAEQVDLTALINGGTQIESTLLYWQQ